MTYLEAIDKIRREPFACKVPDWLEDEIAADMRKQARKDMCRHNPALRAGVSVGSGSHMVTRRDKNRAKVRDAMANGRELSTNDIMATIDGYTKESARAFVSDMANAGLIRCVNKGRHRIKIWVWAKDDWEPSDGDISGACDD